MKLKLILFILFISKTVLFSADIKFYSINSINGISMRETFSVCKDEHGFIWASSKTGILRLSENSYHIYQPPYKTIDFTFLKLLYKNSRLIAFTNNGQLFMFNELVDRFDLLVDLRETADNIYLSISGIAMDDSGTFWIASSNGLYRYQDGILLAVNGKQNNGFFITSVDNNYLFYADQTEMMLLDIKTSDCEVIYRNLPENIIQVSSSYYDEEMGLLWLGTFSHGIYCYDLKKKEMNAISVKGLPRQPVLAIKGNSDVSLLLGIDGQGIWELDKKQNRVLNIYKEDINNPFSLRGDGVYDIFTDDGNRIWVTTYTGGLSFFEKGYSLVNHITHRINNKNSLGNNEVHQIIEDRKGCIWFATDNGISRWNPSVDNWEVYFRNEQEHAQVFLALCEDNDGNIWGGTYSSGIYILDRDNGKKLFHYSGENQNPDEPGKFIFDIFKDSDGDIWIGGVENVVCYKWKEKRFCTYPIKPVNSFYEFSPGRILATYSHGVALLDKETGSIDRLLDGYLAHDVVVIDNHIWVATSGNGLVLYDYTDKTNTWYTTDSGLPSDYVNSIIHTDKLLWVGTENGLCKLDLSTNTLTTCTFIFSLSNLSFNINACNRLRNGDLIWGTNNGAILFSPDMIYQELPEGRIFFQDIIVSGRSIRENQDLIREVPVDKKNSIRLKHYQNTLSLELLSLGHSSGYAKYSWKMEGLETEWSKPSSLSIINYANLPGGNYILMVKMYDNSLTHILDERSLAIEIIPPYWERWLFRVAMALIIIGLVFITLRAYSNHLKQKNAKEKIRFFTGMAHDIRTSVTLITAPIEQLNNGTEVEGKARYYLNLATRQSKRLTSVVTQLLDFEKVDSGKGQLFPVMTDLVLLVSDRCRIFETSAEKKSIKLLFTSDTESFLTGIDVLKIEKIIDNLLSNAIKYSRSGGIIDVSLNCGKDQWSLIVKDNGLGIAARDKAKLFKEFYRGENRANSRIVGSGIGLLLVKNYVKMHDGKIEFDSEENIGSTFKIRIPVKITDNIAHPSQTDNTENKSPFPQKEVNAMTLLDKTIQHKIARILIVEDNEDLQEFLVKSLEDKYKVSTANDGNEAWNLIEKTPFDLIISDIMMPETDGFQLCTKIKSTFETCHIPVILLTSLSQKSKQLEGLGLGADDYITKPFDISLLLQRIHTIIKNRDAIRKKAFKLMNQTVPDNKLYTNELNDKFIKKALEVVRKNMSNTKFGKKEFAAEMNVSPSLLFQKLKSLTEQSPLDFIRSVRFSYAMELLHSQKYTVTEISEMCGFSSPNYFSTAFKKHFGKSPLEVQNEEKSNEK